MVQYRFQVEVRVMTAGKVLEIDVGERAGDGMQVDNVADHEAVMPGARFDANRIVERQCPHARRGEPQRQTCITAGRLDKPHAIPGGLEGEPDMLGNLRHLSYPWWQSPDPGRGGTRSRAL